MANPCGKCAACIAKDYALCLHKKRTCPACQACGGTPIVPETGMCGPCTFGEAEAVGGNW